MTLDTEVGFLEDGEDEICWHFIDLKIHLEQTSLLRTYNIIRLAKTCTLKAMKAQQGTQRAVARKFWQYMKETNRLLETRKELRELYSQSFRPRLNESEKEVKFAEIMWAFRTCLKITVRKDVGEREDITYRVKHQHAVDQYRRMKRQRQEKDDLIDLKKKLGSAKRKDLAADKIGITILPEADEDHVVSIVSVDPHTMVIQLQVYNMALENVSLRCIELECSKDFSVNDRVHKIVSGGKTAELQGNGKHLDFTVNIKALNPGVYTAIVAFVCRRASLKEPFHIIKYIRAQLVNDVVKSLQPVSPYEEPDPVDPETEVEVLIVRGEPPANMMQKVKFKRPLKPYGVPDNLRRDVNNYEIPISMVVNFNKGELTAANHHYRFGKLLHVEELQMEVDIKKYTMPEAELKPMKNGLLSLAVPGLAENRPSLVRGDRLFVRQRSADGRTIERKEYEGFVHKIELDEVHLKFNSRFHKSCLKGSLFNVRFTFSRTTLKLMHRAVEMSNEFLSQIPSKREPSNDEENTTIPSVIRCYERKIEGNPEQKQAVENIVAGTSRPYLVFGPPGTGKTVTIVEAINQVLHISDVSIVLACAPSNSAADLILERVSAQNVIPKTQMIRLNAFGRPEASVSPEIKKFCRLSDDGYFVFPPIDDIKRNYRLVVTTLMSAGRLYSMGLEKSHFTHIFVDEAGHATEPECLVPVSSLLGPEGQLVLAGDPKQLGAVLRSPIAVEFGLGVSFLERLMKFPCYGRQMQEDQNGGYDTKMVTKLLNNYRSHPSIIKVPNEMFYDNELRPRADELLRNSFCAWDGLKKPGFPIIFEPVSGKDQREARSPSYFNAEEVSVVLDYVRKLKEARGNAAVEMKDIGIISPYHKQVQKIRKSLQKEPNNIRDIKVGSVEEFQGQERRVIIISTVRSSVEFLKFDAKFKLGFLDNPKRFNVAITRAKALLIVIGNPHVLCRDQHWRRFIQFCLDNGGFGGSGSFKMPERSNMELIEALEQLNLDKNLDIRETDHEQTAWRPNED